MPSPGTEGEGGGGRRGRKDHGTSGRGGGPGLSEEGSFFRPAPRDEARAVGSEERRWRLVADNDEEEYVDDDDEKARRTGHHVCIATGGGCGEVVLGAYVEHRERCNAARDRDQGGAEAKE